MPASLSSRLREVYLSGTWIAGTNLKTELEATSREQAVHKTGNLNSIAALTYHLDYYLQGLLQVLRGGPLEIRDRYSFDAPEIQTEEDWQQRVQGILQHAAEFAAEVEKLDEATLNRFFVEEKYGTWARNIEGVIEHSYYHLGQIRLLRKMKD